MVINFLPDGREVGYLKGNIVELDLAYAITIHKSQGSELTAVIIPVLTQHFKMLYRNLLYTGLTRAKKLAVFCGHSTSNDDGCPTARYSITAGGVRAVTEG